MILLDGDHAAPIAAEVITRPDGEGEADDGQRRTNAVISQILRYELERQGPSQDGRTASRKAPIQMGAVFDSRDNGSSLRVVFLTRNDATNQINAQMPQQTGRNRASNVASLMPRSYPTPG